MPLERVHTVNQHLQQPLAVIVLDIGHGLQPGVPAGHVAYDAYRLLGDGLAKIAASYPALPVALANIDRASNSLKHSGIVSSWWFSNKLRVAVFANGRIEFNETVPYENRIASFCSTIEAVVARHADCLRQPAIAAAEISSASYRLIECVGKGGFGEVWRAESSRGATVAVKILPHSADQTEIRVLRSISHPCILRYLDSYESDGRIHLVTEFADGGDGEQSIARGQVGPTAAGTWMLPLMRALQHLHEKRIIHRDVKPANLLRIGDRVVLADVGIVRMTEKSRTRHTGTMTLGYAAPEMFEGEVGATSDVYAAGVTAFEFIEGRLPYIGTEASVMRCHLAGRPVFSDRTPDQWRLWIDACMARDPRQRWSAADAGSALPD